MCSIEAVGKKKVICWEIKKKKNLPKKSLNLVVELSKMHFLATCSGVYLKQETS